MPYQPASIFKPTANWRELRFYQKSDALYQLTVAFCRRFLPPYGDRTVDQMVQAARSGKQNIVEGSEDGKTSTEMELKLLNVARASIGELREDYEDYLKSHTLALWDKRHPVDRMMVNYLAFLEKRFVTEGGIKERMHAQRTGYRQQQDARLAALEQENVRLKQLLQAHGIKYE